jgi:ABC-type transport system substrate-binding protein
MTCGRNENEAPNFRSWRRGSRDEFSVCGCGGADGVVTYATFRAAGQSHGAGSDLTSTSVTRGHDYLICDTLFGIAGSDSFRPQMAEGYASDDDGRTYLIRPRNGLKFHDDTPVRAQDCVTSLRRWATLDVVGQTVAQFVEEWSALDDRTIRARLKESLPIFMELIGKGGASVPFIMPEHAAAADPFKPVTGTIGSDPFKFLRSEFVAGSRAVYERNKEYVPRQEPSDEPPAVKWCISIGSSGTSSPTPRRLPPRSRQAKSTGTNKCNRIWSRCYRAIPTSQSMLH